MKKVSILIALIVFVPSISSAALSVTIIPSDDGAGNNIVRLNAALASGDSGEGVQLLQEILSADARYYPEGLVTGYYGPLTARAVARFQTTKNLPATGRADLATIIAVNSFLEEHPIAIENGSHCAIVNGPIQFASDWLKIHGTQLVPVLRACQSVSSEIANQIRMNHLNGADSKGPVISRTEAFAVDARQVHVWVDTDEPSRLMLWLTGGANPSGELISNLEFSTSQKVELKNLLPNTSYTFRITAIDYAGNISVSNPRTFVTLAR